MRPRRERDLLGERDVATDAYDRITIVLAAIAGLVPALASAEPAEAGYPSPFANPVVSIDGGVSGFIDPDLRGLIADGEVWGIRVSCGGFDDIRMEAAYLGTRQGLDPTAGDYILSHGAYGVLRINVAPWLSSIEPFLYLGGGWSRYRVHDPQPGSPLEKSDNVLHIPFGLGVARRVERFVFDVRLGIETASGANLMPIPMTSNSSKGAASMDRFSATAMLGFVL